MAGFDFANASFAKEVGGKFELIRDWNEHPATPHEVEALFAHVMLFESLMATFIRLYGAASIVTAPDLGDASCAEVGRFLASVNAVVMSPPEHAVGVQDLNDACD